MSVSWSLTAAEQLVAARDYFARSSPAYAQALANRIVRRAESLALSPFSGAEVPEFGDQSIRELYEHPYRILYRLDDGTAQVIAVIHSARRLPRIPPA